MDESAANALECRARRPLGPGVPHPDACTKLVLHGVPFAIPPCRARVIPRFDEVGRAGVIVAGVREDPSVALAADEARALIDACVDAGRHDRVRDSLSTLAALMSLARRLLLVGYELDDDQVAALLAFDTEDPPVWIGQLVQWLCVGRHAEPAARREEL